MGRGELQRQTGGAGTGLLGNASDDRAGQLELLIRAAVGLCDGTAGLISGIRGDHDRLVASAGAPIADETSGAVFCNAAIHHPGGVLVGDATADPRFADHELVTGSRAVRSYVGVPVHDGGRRVGAVCVVSTDADAFGEHELDVVRDVGRLVERALEVRWHRDLRTPPTVDEARRLASLLSTAPDDQSVLADLDRPAYVFDPESLVIEYANPAAEVRYGWSLDEFQGRSILDIRPPEEVEMLEAAIREAVADDLDYWNERQMVHWDAARTAFPVILRLVDFERAGRPLRLSVVTDRSAHDRSASGRARSATFDPLTALGNRNHLIEQLRAACAASTSVGLIFLDLDHFKGVNDVAGHRRGDELLVATAARLSTSVPHDAVVTRYGADQFTIVVADSSTQALGRLAERLRSVVAEPFRIGDQEYRLTASVGTAIGDALIGPDELLGRADDALSEAKRQGRNRIVEANPLTRAAHQLRSRLEQDVTRALDLGQLELWFQPVVELTPDPAPGLAGAEALVRWRHPSRGIVPPTAFLPLLFEAGLAAETMRFCLDQSAAAVASLRHEGRRCRIAVNCSAGQLTWPMIDDLQRAIELHGIGPADLRIEVTESAVFDDASEAVRVVEELARIGVKVLIDDFGAGYSSLGRLSQLPVQGLKLDAGFVRATDTESGRRLVRAVAELAHAASLPICVEGIETDEHLAIAIDCGAQFGQGYRLGRPAPLDELPTDVCIAPDGSPRTTLVG